MTKKNKTIKVPIASLLYLRESSGYTLKDIAKKLGRSQEKLENIESGRDFLTMTEIRRLSDIYQRPLIAFFTERISKLETIPDYRINREKKLTPEIFLAERRAQYLASKIAELSEKQSQIPIFPEDLTATQLVESFKKLLKIDNHEFRKYDEILPYYKKILEEKLSILIIEYPFRADDIRAFSIFSKMSIIVLNESDKSTVKLFSLFHEVCHLLKRTSAICSIEIEQENKQSIENYCDSFSAEFLVPRNNLEIAVKGLEKINWSNISDISQHYGVSKQVVMLRLLFIRKIDGRIYNMFKETFYKEKMEKNEFARRKWEKVFFNRVGNLAIKEVSGAYKKGDIAFSEATGILNVKTKYAEKLIG
ncbi:MAG: ImmA/IrrE family metallo-endopeptidase [Candidatus Aenigmarchaeota archaeon]|nr:ImmA/IrrE family metallo-endopeptidase [Candidatus Aenigmarchaeota archaeon]